MAFDEKVRIIIEAVGAGKAASEIGQLDDKMAKSGKAATGWKKDLGDAGSFIGNNLPAMAAGGAAAIGAFAVKAVGAFQDTALSAGKLAEATGLTTEQASRWNEVAQDVGASTGDVEVAFRKLAQNIGQNPEKLKELGLQIRYATDGTVDMNATVLSAIDLLHNAKDGTVQAATGAALFGKNWSSMSELIGRGSSELAGHLADVSDAKIIDDSELRKARAFRDTMDTLNDVVEDLTLTFGQFVIDGIAPTLTAIGELGSKITAIGQLGGGGGGLFAKILGNVPVAGSLEGLNVALDGSADATDRLKGAATAILPPLKALPFGLFDTETAADQASRKLEELTETAKGVKQGFDPAGAAAAGFIGSMSGSELAAAKTAAAQRGLADAAKDLAEKQSEAAAAAEEQAAALELVNAAAKTQLDAFLTLPDAIDAQTEAFSEMAKAAGEFNKQPTAETLGKVEEKAKSLAAADVALAKATALGNNVTFDRVKALDVENSSYLKQAATLQGPAKQAIIDRIAQLNGIPAAKLTDILARIPPGDIPAAEAALKAVSRSRDAAIRAEATNVGYTEQQIANLARNRTAYIHVQPAGPGRTSVLAGGRASGGPVEAGMPYTVGESGRELFVPDVNGRIINAADTARSLAGGSGVGGKGATTIINMTVTSADPQKVMDALDQYVRTQGSRRLQRMVAV